eukprot:CAMPEP_0179949428 /NCGR_PEP_ID=MMETSP0983-20121128/22329_1 /TAXON_ID=483367 /ORGANISM="non described non described, Strain CCMP 2436" /LENGTH=67 /DNA_ID=CAMNT_0021859165 /DNA_START=449 /DNA_END=652 /DNA_ORIENTATION=-
MSLSACIEACAVLQSKSSEPVTSPAEVLAALIKSSRSSYGSARKSCAVFRPDAWLWIDVLSGTSSDS